MRILLRDQASALLVHGPGIEEASIVAKQHLIEQKLPAQYPIQQAI
jgi:hypothetical protein